MAAQTAVGEGELLRASGIYGVGTSNVELAEVVVRNANTAQLTMPERPTYLNYILTHGGIVVLGSSQGKTASLELTRTTTIGIAMSSVPNAFTTRPFSLTLGASCGSYSHHFGFEVVSFDAEDTSSTHCQSLLYISISIVKPVPARACRQR